MKSVNHALASDPAEEALPRTPVAVLISGGLDSAILLAEALVHSRAVHPLYVRTGMYWEEVELGHLRRFLEVCKLGQGLKPCPNLQPLHVLEMPVTDLYGSHWSITGTDVPDALSPDEAVFLPGRNVLLLAKAMLWCHLHNVPAVALATLRANPFPDATPAFFASYQQIVNQAIAGSVRVLRPYANLAKLQVMQRSRGLPLELTFSCIRPVADRHCGRCNKCAERRLAFRAAQCPDATRYDSALPIQDLPLRSENDHVPRNT